MNDTLHLCLTAEELKGILRRGVADAGLEPPILAGGVQWETGQR